jgi:hypothetical protein
MLARQSPAFPDQRNPLVAAATFLLGSRACCLARITFGLFLGCNHSFALPASRVAAFSASSRACASRLAAVAKFFRQFGLALESSRFASRSLQKPGSFLSHTGGGRTTMA